MFTKSLVKTKKAAFVAAIVVGAAVPASAMAHTDKDSVKLSFVAYSTPKDAMTTLIPGFQATPAGQSVTFSQSYGGSGSQTRAILAGLPADVIDLSLQTDMDSL